MAFLQTLLVIVKPELACLIFSLMRQMVVELLHASWGAYRQLSIAPKFSLTPGTLRSHAPELGEHTAEILAEIGMNGTLQEHLKAGGVI